MTRKTIVRLVAAVGLVALLIPAWVVSAHQTVTAGNYVVEYGWTNEPALTGYPNAVAINIGPKQVDASQTGASISLMSPTNMAGVQGDKVDVSVQFAGIDSFSANAGMHWHLYVDDQDLAMAPLDQTTITVSGLANGVHTVKAVLAAPDHTEVGTPAQTMIQVSGSTASTGPMAQNVQSMSMPADMNAGFSVDVSALTVEVAYGGQTKVLQLQPLPDGEPGQYMAPFVPTKAGQYTLNLSGKLSGSAGDADVKLSVNPEDVEPVAGYAFPTLPTNDSSANSFGLTGWLAVAALVVGLASLGLWIFIYTRKS